MTPPAHGRRPACMLLDRCKNVRATAGGCKFIAMGVFIFFDEDHDAMALTQGRMDVSHWGGGAAGPAKALVSATRLVAAALAAVLIGGGVGRAQVPTIDPSGVSIDIGDGVAAPGQTFTIVVTLHNQGANIIGVQNQIDFSAPLQIAALPGGAPDCSVNPNIEKEATSFAFVPAHCTPGATCTGMRSFVLSFENKNPIGDGEIYTCRIVVDHGAAQGTYRLLNSDLGASDERGAFIDASGTDGSVIVTRTSTSIDVGDAEVSPGTDALVSVRLTSGGVAIVGAQNRIDFTRDVHVAASVGGAPDCTVEPSIDKPQTNFIFLPVGCVANACTGIRAIVLSFSNLEPIPDGSVLYTCRVVADAGALPGTYFLRNSEQAGSTRDHQLVVANGRDGIVRVDDAMVAIDVGNVRTVGGGRATLEVRFEILRVDAPAVAGLENEILFDPIAAIAANSDGQPDCQVEPSINKNATNFVFSPSSCTPGINCTGMHAFVLAFDNTAPIPNGTVLYRCAVEVAKSAPVGVYPLVNAATVASDPMGNPVAMRGGNGQIEVVCASDCDGNGRVAIFELVRGVNILLGNSELSACPSADADGSETVKINDMILGVLSALNGCGPM